MYAYRLYLMIDAYWTYAYSQSTHTPEEKDFINLVNEMQIVLNQA